jgi:hypothetical protein
MVQRCIESTSPIWPDSVGNELRILAESLGLARVDFSSRIAQRRMNALEDAHTTPTPAPAPALCKHEEIIAALQKQVQTLTAQVTAVTARPACCSHTRSAHRPRFVEER